MAGGSSGCLSPLRKAIAAAALAVTVYSVWTWRGEREFVLWRAESRLNRIYETSRPFVYRWAGAGRARPAAKGRAEGVASVRVQLLRAKPLLEADPRWLRLMGRAALLEANYEDAVRQYRRALALEGNGTGAGGIQTELACAYALRGEADGRAADLGPALDYAAKALLRGDRDAITYFDAALILEKAWMLKMAAHEFRLSEAADRDGAWRAEAAQRAKRIEESVARRAAGMEALKDPRNVTPEPLKFPGAPELAQQYAVENWIALEPRPEQPLRAIADAFERQFGDLWWRDYLSQPRSAAGTRLLRGAYEAYLHGRFAEAGETARQAEAEFARAGNHAGRLRAREERVRASHRGDHPQSCEELMNGFAGEVTRRSYKWLETLNSLDEITCRNTLGKGGAFNGIETVARRVEEIGFPGMGSFVTAALTAADETLATPLRGWQRLIGGFEGFRKAYLADVRLRNLSFNLANLAAPAGQTGAAWLAHRESALHLDSEHDPGMISQAMGDLSLAESAVGLYADSVREGDLGAQAAGRGGGIPAKHWFRLETSRAWGELDSGRAEQALRRVTALEREGRYGELPNDQARADAEKVAGLALLRLGRYNDAAVRFQAVLDIHRRDIGESGRVEKESRQRLQDAAIEGLTEARLKRGDDPAQVLDGWLNYRRGLTPGADGTAGLTLVAAELPGGVSLWLADSRGVAQKWLGADREKEAFVTLERLAADPGIPPPIVHRAAQTAERLLLGAFAARMSTSAGSVLRIHATGFLARVPWAVLENEKGIPLIERYPIVRVVYAGTGTRSHREPVAVERAAVFADPDPGVRRAEFPSLPDALSEGRRVARQMGAARLYYGAEATEAAFVDAAPKAAVLHYAGHGVAYGGFGGLVLAGDRGFLTSERIARLDLSRMRLAVLAACSSGVTAESGDVNGDVLVRGFLDAGARAVLAAAWDVDSAATKAFMEQFYTAVSRGTDPARAVREAAGAVRAMRGFEHPAMWAGFQLFERQ
jgi:tetratricopeptide (TPR) repeat protein